jgi:uncharacterized protein YecE (DUF72 family)
VVASFLKALRGRFGGDVACEPRHPSWFTDEADDVLSRFRVARAAADPARVPRAAEPGGWGRLAYFRLHGSPRMYHSRYATEYLDALALRLAEAAAVAEAAWCVFDNTALGEATGDALGLLSRLSSSGRGSGPVDTGDRADARP